MSCIYQYDGKLFRNKEALINYLKGPREGVEYNLKAVNAIIDGQSVFEKGKKNGWSLDKILTELQIPKEQKEIILDINKSKLNDSQNKELDNIVQERGLLDSKNPSTELYKILRKLVPPNIKIKISYGRSGSWNSRSNELVLGITGEDQTKSHTLKTLNHELLHSVTNLYVTKYEIDNNVGVDTLPEYAFEVTKNISLTENQNKQIEDLITIYNHIVKNIDFSDYKYLDKLKRFGKVDYFNQGVNNDLLGIHELISEAFTNPELINILKNEKGIFNKKTTLFKDFLNKILQLFNITKSNLLEDIYASVENLIHDQDNLRDEILIKLLAEYTQPVEIVIAGREMDGDRTDTWFEDDKYFYTLDQDTGKYYRYDSKDSYTPLEPEYEISKKEYYKQLKKVQSIPTDHYARMSAPGGTNYKELRITTPNIEPSIKGHAEFADVNDIGWARVDDRKHTEKIELEEFENNEDESSATFVESYPEIDGPKTLRVQEIQSDLFQKGRDRNSLVGMQLLDKSERGELSYEERKKLRNSKNPNRNTQNQFLQLLNQRNNWVTFFVRSLIQDASKKGYEKMLFPSGNTAAKIEGHQTLEEFKKQKEDRIKELEEKLNNQREIESKAAQDIFESSVIFGEKELTSQQALENVITGINNEINQLKQELADVESGQTKLSSIAKFYEETIHNVLKKQGFNPERITDEHGNDWFEIQVPEEVDVDLLPKEEEKPYKEFNKEANDELDALLERTREREEILAQLKALKEEHPEIDGILFNDLSIPGVSFSNQRQLIESIAEEVSRLRYDQKRTSLNEVLARWKGMLAEVAQAAPQYKDHLDRYLNNWHQVEASVRRFLVKRTGYTLDEIEESEASYEKRNYEEDSSFTSDPKLGMSGRIKRFFSFIPDPNNRHYLQALNKHFPKFKFESYIPFDEVYNNLTAWIDGARSNFNDMLDKIRQVDHPWRDAILDKLANAKDQIKNEFVAVMSKHYVSMVYVLLGNKGGVTNYTVNFEGTSAMTSDVMKRWNYNLKSAPIAKFEDGEYYIDENVAKKLYNQIHFKTTEGKDVVKTLKPEELSGWLANFGIEIPAEFLEQITKSHPLRHGRKSFDYSDLFYTKGSPVTILIDKLTNYTGDRREVDSVDLLSDSAFSSLAKQFAKHVGDVFGNSTRIGGKVVYAFTNNKYIPNRLRDIIDGLVDFSQTAYTKYVTWTDPTSLKFMYLSLSPIKKIKGRKSGKLNTLGPKDHELIKINMYFNNGKQIDVGSGKQRRAIYFYPTNSDKTTTVAFEAEARNVTPELLLNSMVRAEAERILEFQDSEHNIQSFNPGIFYTIPELNDIPEIWTEDHKLMPNYLEHSEQILDAIRGHLSTLVKQRLQTWKDLGIGLEHMSQYFKESMAQQTEVTLGKIASDYETNYLLANYNMSAMFWGDPALYYKQAKKNKGAEEYDYTADVRETFLNVGKRLAADIAPGYEMNSIPTKDMPANFRLGIIKDLVLASKYKDEYQKVLGKEGYNKINVADAQEFVTFTEHLRVLLWTGKINAKQHRSLVNKFERGVKLEESELDLVLQPMKPVYVNNYLYGKLFRRVYIKSSAIPLIPQLTKGLQIDKLRLAMEKHVDRLAFESAVKVGGHANPNAVFDENGDILDDIDFGEILNLPREGFRIQQDIPDKEGDKITVGTQERKLLFSHMKKLLPDLYRKYVDKYISDFNEAFEGFRDELTTNGEVDVRKLARIIRDEGLERDYSPNDIKAMSSIIGNKFRYPLWALPSANRIESLLTSIVDNRVRKQKHKGRSYVLVTEAGFRATNKDTGILYVGEDREIAPMRKLGDKVIPAKVLARWNFRDSEGKLLPYPKNASDIPKELLRLYGFRIPTQGHNSMAVMEIIGFLPPDTTDMIVAPKEFVEQMGSDFDIDKLYVYEPSSENLKKTDSEIFDIHWQVMTHPKVFGKIITPLSSGNLKELAEEVAPDPGDFFSPFSSEYQKTKYINATAGKGGIGVFSLTSVFHSMLQDENIRVKMAPITINGYTFTGILSRIKDFAGNDISNNIEHIQSVSVDNEKEQLLDKININAHTFGVANIMYLAGFPEDTIVYFLSQPILRDYVAKRFDNESIVADSKADEVLIKEIESNYPATLRVELTNANLKQFIKDPAAPNFNEGQRQVLDIFLELQKANDSVRSLMYTLNTDSQGLGKNFAATSTKMNFLVNLPSSEVQGGEALVGEYSYVKKPGFIDTGKEVTVWRNDMLVTLPVYIKPTTIVGGASVHSLTAVSKYFQNLYPYEHPVVEALFQEMINILDISDPGQKERLKQNMFEAMKAFIYANKIPLRPELTNGVLATKVVQIQKESKNKPWANNLFLHRLIPNIDKRGASLIEFNASQADGMDTDYINMSIEDLRQRELLPGYSGEQFIEDLFDYSLAIGGRQQANEFIKYLPLELWDKLKLHEFQFTEDFFGFTRLKDSAFARQFIQHNENLLPQYETNEGKTPNYIQIPDAVTNYISYNLEPYERVDEETFKKMESKGGFKYLQYTPIVNTEATDYRPGPKVQPLPQSQVEMDEYVKNIQYTSSDPMLREFAAQIPEMNVPIIVDYDLPAKGITSYKRGTEIRINPNNHSSRTDLDITILHELTHGFTKSLIVDYRNGKLEGETLEKMKKLDGLFKLFRERMIRKYGAEKYKQIIDEAKEGLDLERAGKNLEEFMAILPNSRKMQQFMDGEMFQGDMSWKDRIWKALTDLFKTRIPKLSEYAIKTILELGAVYTNRQNESEPDFNPSDKKYDILLNLLESRNKKTESEIAKAKEEFRKTHDPEVLKRLDVQEERLRNIVKKIEEVKKFKKLSQATTYIKDRIDEITQELKSPYLSLDYLIKANDELKVFSKMGDFSTGETHLLLSDIEKASPQVRDEFRILRNMSEEIQNKINTYLDNYLKNWVNQQIDGDLSVEQVKQAMKDINSWRRFGYDLSRIPDSLAQATHIQIKKARFEAQKDISHIVEVVDKLYGKIDPELRKFFLQKDEYGNDTGRVTHYFSSAFFKAENEVWDTYKEAKTRHNYQRAVQWAEKNQIRFDVNLFFPEKGQVDQAKLDAHIKELKRHLGDHLFNKYYERLESKIEEYRAKREVAIERINSDPAITDKQSEIDLWIKRNSPYLIGKELFHNDKLVANKGYVYTYSLPRRYDENGRQTGWYDSNYLEIESRPELQEFHEYLLDQLYHLNSLIPESQREGITNIPFFRKSFVELFSKNETRLGAFPEMYDRFLDTLKTEAPSTKDTEDRDPITGLKRSTAELRLPNKRGEIEKLVKIEIYQFKADKGRLPTEDEEKKIRSQVIHKVTQEQSLDLGKVLKLYAMHVYNYHHASKVEDIMNLAVETMAQRKEIDVNKAGIPLLRGDEHAKKDGLKKVNDVMQYSVDVFLGSPMYDLEKVTRWKLKTTKEKRLEKRKKEIAESPYLTDEEKADLLSKEEGGYVVLSHIGDMLLKYIQLKGMGYNLPGAISNLGFGTISNIRMAADGRLFQMKHMGQAYSMIMHSIAKNATFNHVETEIAKKIRNIMDKWDFAKDVSNEFYKASRRSPITRRLRWLTPYQLQKRTEYINQAALIVALMLNDKLSDYGYDSDMTLWDAFDSNGESQFDLTKFKIKGDQLIKIIHGNYDSDSPILGKKTVSGRAVLQFKTWALEGVAQAWEDEKYDNALGIELKGRFRTAWFGFVLPTEEHGAFSNTAFAIKSMLGKAQLSERFSEVDAANIRASVVDLAITMSLFAILALLQAGDDKEKGFMINLLINQMTRMQGDMFNYIAPGQISNTITNAVPLTTTVDDAARWFVSLGKVIDGDTELKSGPNKGRNRLGVSTLKMLPFGTQVDKLRRLQGD